MSCGLKQSNSQRVTPRSDYYLQMMENYNPTREGYNAPPWPTRRTNEDKQLQKHWCPKCPTGGCKENYDAPPWPTRRSEADKHLQNRWCPTCPKGGCKENYDAPYGAPYTSPRSAADIAMKDKWCPSCPSSGSNCKENYYDYLQSMQDTDNPWSYSTKPYSQFF